MREKWNNFKLLIINFEMLNTYKIQPKFLHAGQGQIKAYTKKT